MSLVAVMTHVSHRRATYALTLIGRRGPIFWKKNVRIQRIQAQEILCNLLQQSLALCASFDTVLVHFLLDLRPQWLQMTAYYSMVTY